MMVALGNGSVDVKVMTDPRNIKEHIVTTGHRGMTLKFLVLVIE